MNEDVLRLYIMDHTSAEGNQSDEVGGRTEAVPAGQTLVLDDFLHQVRAVKSDPKSLRSQAGAEPAIRKLIQETIKRCGGEVYAKPNAILDEVGKGVYGRREESPAYSGHRISNPYVESVLAKLFELGLEAIVSMPSRDRKEKYSPKRLRALGDGLSDLAGELQNALSEASLRGRIALLAEMGKPTGPPLPKLATDMREAADAIDAALKSDVIRVRRDSPNPQVRWAMYFIGWIESCTGAPHYGEVATLIEAAFHARKKPVPRWAQRLAIEMNSKRARRSAGFAK